MKVIEPNKIIIIHKKVDDTVSIIFLNVITFFVFFIIYLFLVNKNNLKIINKTKMCCSFKTAIALLIFV